MPSWVDATVPEQRILEQSMRLRAGGAVTGWGSLRLHRAAYFDGLEGDGTPLLPVPLAAGRGGSIRSGSGASVSREPLDPAEVVQRHGIPVTRPCRALFDEMRRGKDWREAVVAMDMAAAAEVVSIAQMLAYLAGRSGWRRASRMAKALRHAGERSGSPNETQMHLVWVVDAGPPPPLVRQEIFTLDGRLVAVADLLDEEAGVVGEYDGSGHLGTRRRSRDIGREERLRRLGLEYFDVVRPDLDDPARLAERMRSTRSRAAFLPPAERRWTIEPPAGWPREQSLDERLFLLDMARQMDRELGR